MSLNRNTILLSGVLAVGAFNANAQDAGKEVPVVRNYGVFHGIAVEDSIRNMLGQEGLAAQKLDETRYQVSALDTIGPEGDVVRARSYFLESQDGMLDANEITGREVVFAQLRGSSRQSGLLITEKMDTISHRLLPFIEGANWSGNPQDESYELYNEFEEIRPFIPVRLQDRSGEEHRSFDYGELVSYLEGEIREYGAKELFRNVELLDEAAEQAESHYRFQRSVESLVPDLR